MTALRCNWVEETGNAISSVRLRESADLKLLISEPRLMSTTASEHLYGPQLLLQTEIEAVIFKQDEGNSKVGCFPKSLNRYRGNYGNIETCLYDESLRLKVRRVTVKNQVQDESRCFLHLLKFYLKKCVGQRINST